MRQDEMDVIFEEIERFAQTVVARLLALEEPARATINTAKPKGSKSATNTVAAKHAAKVSNGVRGRPRLELSRAKAAAYLGVHEATIANLSQRGALPSGHKNEGRELKLFYYQTDLDA